MTEYVNLTESTVICHYQYQSSNCLNQEVLYSLYEPDGTKSMLWERSVELYCTVAAGERWSSCCATPTLPYRSDPNVAFNLTSVWHFYAYILLRLAPCILVDVYWVSVEVSCFVFRVEEVDCGEERAYINLWMKCWDSRERTQWSG